MGCVGRYPYSTTFPVYNSFVYKDTVYTKPPKPYCSFCCYCKFHSSGTVGCSYGYGYGCVYEYRYKEEENGNDKNNG